MRLKFFGHRVLILGGSCELALRLGQFLIEEGLLPILTWRSEEGRSRITESFRKFSGKYEAQNLDFAQRVSIGPLLSHLGGDLDYLVDFAQSDLESLVGSVNPDAVYPYFAENVAFRAEVLRMASRLMLRKQRGRMVFVSSSAAGKPNPGQGFYSASKLASEALYRNLGLELGSRGITTVTLRPGYIDSGRGRNYMLAVKEDVSRAIPIGRALSADEVAEAILFLLSDSAGGFNATELTMDGGLSAGK